MAIGHRALYLGIDGGATNTTALLAVRVNNDLQVIGRGVGGSSNINNVGAERALHSLNSAVAKAFVDAKIKQARVRSACFGIAGAENPLSRERIESWAQKIALAHRVEVVNDAVIILAAGTPNGLGVAVIAGTGSSIYARLRTDQKIRTGGWGYLIGDAGSAYSLTMKAMQAVAAEADGVGKPTALTKRFLEAMNIQNARELSRIVYAPGNTPASIAGFAPMVLECAQGEDAVALTIVKNEAKALADLVASAVDKCGVDPRVFPIPLALTGSVLVKNEWYRAKLLRYLGAVYNIFGNPVTIVTDPAEGALRRALNAK